MAIVLWGECEHALSVAIQEPAERLRTELRPVFLVAAVMHDFMKANSDFQEMLVANDNRKTQPIRHEILGALQLWQHSREWLSRGIGEHHFQMRQRREGETDDQELSLQIYSLVNHGVKREHIFSDKLSGAKADRPGLARCQECLRRGNALVVWRLDRLGRSMRHLITIIKDLKE